MMTCPFRYPPQMSLYWIMYTEETKQKFTPFRPNHSVPADRYVADGDWLEFRDTYEGVARPVPRHYGPIPRSARWRPASGHPESEDRAGVLGRHDLVPSEAELEQDLLGVLAVFGCRDQLVARLIHLDRIGHE